MMRPRLLTRKRAICAYAGIETDPRGNPIPTAPPRPMNLTKRGADVLVAHLAANPPTHEFVARRLQMRGRATALSIAMDNLNAEIDRVQVSRQALLNALLSERSVIKTGVRSGAELVKINGRLYDPGQPYAKLVDNDDHAFDWTARCREEMKWESHRYRVQKSVISECGLFNPDEIAKLPNVGERSRASDQDAHSHLIGGEQAEDGFLFDVIELMDVVFYFGDGSSWLCTCAGNPDDHNGWLRIEEWTGPERGPFEWLEFYPVPNNIMGVSWAQVTAVQELICSKLMTKIVESVLNAKKGVGVKGGADQKELDAVQSGPDGFLAKFGQDTVFESMELGGAVKDAFQLLGPVMNSWNVQSGNVDVLSGSGTDTDTATEYQGLAANAGVVMSYLQKIVHEHEERKSRKLAFYLQNDPTRQFMSPHRLPNGEYIEVMYDPMAQEDDHTDYEYRIRQNSMKATDPNVLLRRLNEMYTVFLPTGALLPVEAGRTWCDLAGIDNADALFPDPMRDMAMQAAMSGVPPPIPGQPTGMSMVNPAAMYGAIPQGAQRPGMGGPANSLKPTVGMGGGQQTSPLAAGMSARANRVPA